MNIRVESTFFRSLFLSLSLSSPSRSICHHICLYPEEYFVPARVSSLVFVSCSRPSTLRIFRQPTEAQTDFSRKFACYSAWIAQGKECILIFRIGFFFFREGERGGGYFCREKIGNRIKLGRKLSIFNDLRSSKFGLKIFI